MSEGVICQPLDALVVAIHAVDSNIIEGTGFIVSSEQGLILTCAHVVRNACNCQLQIGQRVGVHFSNESIEQRDQIAIVVGGIPDLDDDIALLKLEKGAISLNQAVFELGLAELSYKKDFSSYGYGCTKKNDSYLSAPVEGRILGPVESNLKLSKKRIYLSTQIPILAGHSGAPVLDQALNRIVGIIIDSNDNNAGHATDCAVLTLDNFKAFELPFSNIPVPKTTARTPRVGVIDTIIEDFSISDTRSFGVPEPTYEKNEWIGRDQLLQSLTNNWVNPEKRLSALIGFGGEGKSSIARRWLDDLIEKNVFWWSFYRDSDVDAFFEASFHYLSDGKYPRPKKETRAEKLAAFLYTGKYLFILDGLEVIQHSDLDHYGDIANEDLQLFLEYFAAPNHDSRCLITSRLPLRFSHYTTFTHYDVDRLSKEDGCKLLRNLGVQDDDIKLEAVVQAWEGHALTLSLIGAYICEKYKGKITHDLTVHIKDMHGNERRREQVSRMLNRYDIGLLDETDKAFLLIFSVFRRPVNQSAISYIAQSINMPEEQITRLVNLRVLRFNTYAEEYTIHPLIRQHYQDTLAINNNKYISAHTVIYRYYLTQIPQVLDGDNISINSLVPLIEAIFHTCSAGEYDDAYTLYSTPRQSRSSGINGQRNYEISDLLINWLGAYDITQDLLRSFFPENAAHSSPKLHDARSRSTIFDHLGQCSMYLGKLDEAAQYYEQAISSYEVVEDWSHIATVYRHLSALFIQRGDLDRAYQAGEKALHLSEDSEDVQSLLGQKVFLEGNSEIRQNSIPLNTIASAALLGYIDAVRGETDLYFAYMLDLSEGTKLPRGPGLWYATYLERFNSTILADFLKHSIEEEVFPSERSQWHRIRAQVAANSGNLRSASEYFDNSVMYARASSRRHLLIEALIARSKWLAKITSFNGAKQDLEEALTLSQNRYRLYEADIRVCLAWVHHSLGNQQAARKEVSEADRISRDIGYAWACQDVKEISALIDKA